MAKMWKSDYQLSFANSSVTEYHSNEAERTNTAIADSVVDGGTIDRQKVKLFLKLRFLVLSRL